MRHFNKLASTCALALSLSTAYGNATEPPTGIVGKNDWLFYRLEIQDPSEAARADVSLDLIARFNKVLSANGVGLVVVMVPLKMRIYSEHLPDSIPFTDYMRGNYDRLALALKTAQVNTIDLNTAFLNSPLRQSEDPLFFRLDTHWSPTGAMVAAETVKAGIHGNATLKRLLDTIPEERYTLVNGGRQRNQVSRDLLNQLPSDAPTIAPERVSHIYISRTKPLQLPLQGDRPGGGLTLLGSSYSRDWTGFADYLRYTLQRDLLGIGVPADRGSWVGMEGYLRDDSFQKSPPKLLIWEMPERDMRAPPDYEFREPRYVSNNTEWLLRVSALVQTRCRPSAASAKLKSVGLGAHAAYVKGSALATGPTLEGDFIEIEFDRPIQPTDYLTANVSIVGSKSILMESLGTDESKRTFTLPIADDGMAHTLKTPLPSPGSDLTRLRIFPGKSSGFNLQNIQLCRQPDDLLPKS